jgi:hypothetical protein
MTQSWNIYQKRKLHNNSITDISRVWTLFQETTYTATLTNTCRIFLSKLSQVQLSIFKKCKCRMYFIKYIATLGEVKNA